MKLLALLSTAAFPVAFMSDTVETVLVKGGKDGPVRVNKSDYDADQSENGEKKMTLHNATQSQQKEAEIDKGGNPQNPQIAGNVQLPVNPDFPPQPAPAAPDFGPTPAAAPTAPSPNQRLVKKDGKKFLAVDGQGTPLDIDGIDPKGYASEAEAWNAIMALPH